MYIENTDIKSITTKDKNDNSGMFRIEFEDDNNDEVYFYNIVEKDNNIDKTRPIFDELFKTEIGDKNAKFNFVILDDVITHGDSFRTAAHHLYFAGAKYIVPLAIGKTVIPNE